MAMNLFDLTGKVVLVTGGNSGLGLGYARGIAKAGGDVVIWGRNSARNEQAVGELQQYGGRVVAQQVDTSDEAQVIAGIRDVVAQMGRLDCVFANAGIPGQAASILELKTAEYLDLIAVSQHGVFYTLREAARHMVARAEAGDPGGSLVATGSLSMYLGLPGAEHYAAAKAATGAVVRGMAAEFGKYGIRANLIAPGYIKTGIQRDWDSNQTLSVDAMFAERTPIPRVGEIEDFEGIAVYLASDQSRFHSGDTIVIDGGYLIGL